MYGIDDRGWLKTYVWGELTWMNMELFEVGGEIETNDSLDKRLTKAVRLGSPDKDVLEKLMGVLYSAKRFKPSISSITGEDYLVEKYKKNYENPDMDTLLAVWDYIFTNGIEPEVVAPEKDVPYNVSVNFAIRWLEDHEEDVDAFIQALKDNCYEEELNPKKETEENEMSGC